MHLLYGVSILTTLEKLASHVGVETPTVKPALGSVYGGKSCFILLKLFQKLVQIRTDVVIQKAHQKALISFPQW